MSAAAENMQANKAVVKAKKRSLKKNVAPHEFNGPSKPPSGFMLFSSKHREAVTEAIRASLKADEKFAIKMVASKMGEKWKVEPEESKKAFNKQAEELKAKFDADLEKWKLTADYKLFVKASALHSKKKADKKATDAAKASGMPARPMAAYFSFSNEIREEVRKEIDASGEKYTVMLSAKITKQKWDALGEEGQKPHQEKYQVAKAKYAEELAAWQESDAGKTFAKAKATNQKRKAQNSRVGKKAKRAKKDAEEENDDDSEEEDAEAEVSGAEEEVEGGEEEAGSSPEEEEEE